jgi:hypothetical protein
MDDLSTACLAAAEYAAQFVEAQGEGLALDFLRLDLEAEVQALPDQMIFEIRCRNELVARAVNLATNRGLISVPHGWEIRPVFPPAP